MIQSQEKRVKRFFEQGKLVFAVGIEDTFVPQQALGLRALDEYELTQHYDRWGQDLQLAADTGARMIRYGLPWYRINPEPGVFRWDWLDSVVDKLEELSLTPIVDLMHYGTPLWLDNQFLNEAYPEAVAEYAGRVAERYGQRLPLYTPLNEPLINAMFCGEDGRWPPYLKGHDGFVKLVRALSRGIVATQRAVHQAASGQAVFVHVEATFRFEGKVDLAAEEVQLLRDRCFLVEDLITGRVGDDHPLAGYLTRGGLQDSDFAWFRENTAQPDIMGINYYPHLSTWEYSSEEPRRPRRRKIVGGEGLEELVHAFVERYRCPVFVTETSIAGSAEKRRAWLEESVALCRALVRRGVPLVGYTWWPLFDLIDWDYRESLDPVENFLVPMGLYDLVPDDIGRLQRVPNAALEAYRRHARKENESKSAPESQ
jgi:beta-glucosidase